MTKFIIYSFFDSGLLNLGLYIFIVLTEVLLATDNRLKTNFETAFMLQDCILMQKNQQLQKFTFFGRELKKLKLELVIIEL